MEKSMHDETQVWRTPEGHKAVPFCEQDGNRHLTDFLATKKFPGKLIFGKIWGSRSHHTEKPTSDWDYAGVYVVPTKILLGLQSYAQTVDNNKEKKESNPDEPDYAFHEAHKFCTLLLKGNFGILEMLWTEKMYVADPMWLELKAIRRKFLSQKAVRQYLGFAEGQLKQLIAHEGKGGLHTKGGAFNEKWAYHIVRVLGDAMRIATGGDPEVWKEGKERDFLMRIRAMEVTHDYIAGYISEQLALIRGMEPWNLPKHGDEAALEDWLIRLRNTNP